MTKPDKEDGTSESGQETVRMHRDRGAACLHEGQHDDAITRCPL